MVWHAGSSSLRNTKSMHGSVPLLTILTTNSILECAKAELSEEVGLIEGEWIPLSEAPGISEVYFYYST